MTKTTHALVRAAGVLLAASTAMAATTLVAQTAQVVSGTSSKAKLGTWGVDLTSRDTSVKPGDDFQKFASGSWLAKTQIPADKPEVGSFYEVYDISQDQLKAVVTSAPATSKYGALYQSMMDEARAETVGIAPLKEDLAVVAAIKNKTDFARHMGVTDGTFGASIVSFHLEPDTADATMNALYLNQSWPRYAGPRLLPEARSSSRSARPIALTSSGRSGRSAFRTRLPPPTRILAFETAIAQKSWPSADRRDIDKTNNPMSTAELAKYAPGSRLGGLLRRWRRCPSQKRIIVNENSAIRDIAAIYAKTPLSTLKEWQAFHTADQAAPYLNKAMVDSRFQYTKTITGVTEHRPRWKRAITLVDGSLGELVGQDYVAALLPAASKAKMVELVANLKPAMAARIQRNSWMSAPTKAAALEKLGGWT